MKQYNKPRTSQRVDNPLATQLSFLRGVFLANHLANTDNLTSNNPETEHIQTQPNVNIKVSLINNMHTKNLC